MKFKCHFRGRCSTWWSSSVTFRGRCSTWWSSSVTFRGRRSTSWSGGVTFRGRRSIWWRFECKIGRETLYFTIENAPGELEKSLYLCKRGFYFYKRVFEKLCLFNITCQRPCCLHLCCLKVCVSWKASSQRTCAVIAIFLESIPCENMLTWPILFEHCLLENIISVFSKHRKYVPACIQINLMTFCFFPEKDLQRLR